MAEPRGEIVLEARNISKTYGGVKALDNVSLVLRAGEVHCLAGENGCGKSTLIKIISGAERPDSGEIVVDGDEHDRVTPAWAIRQGIQVIYQDFSLFPNLTVAENITLTSSVAKRAKLFSARNSRPAAEQIVRDLGLDLDLDADVENLSVADKQLTAICRALVNDARVIIMDEPTTALTRREVDRLFSIVRKLQERGVSLVFVSHKLEEALSVSQEITVLRSGKHVISAPADEFTRVSLTKYMTGRDIDDTRVVPTPDYETAPALEVTNLNLAGAYRDVSFSVAKGEIVGITGLLGSGRGEIAESLFGVIPAESGTIAVDGSPVKIRKIKDAIRSGIGYVPEDRLTQGLFLERSIADNMIAASVDRYRKAGTFVDGRRIAEKNSSLFADLRIKAPNVDAPVRSLSGGNAQRVVLAKWLATEPRVLILNGPTVGVDVGSKEEILSILRRGAEMGMGIVVISDDVPELVAVCNRVLVIRDGEILREFAGDAIDTEKIHEEMAA